MAAQRRGRNHPDPLSYPKDLDSRGMPPTETQVAGHDGAVKSHEWDPPHILDKPDIPFKEV